MLGSNVPDHVAYVHHHVAWKYNNQLDAVADFINTAEAFVRGWSCTNPSKINFEYKVAPKGVKLKRTVLKAAGTVDYPLGVPTRMLIMMGFPFWHDMMPKIDVIKAYVRPCM